MRRLSAAVRGALDARGERRQGCTRSVDDRWGFAGDRSANLVGGVGRRVFFCRMNDAPQLDLGSPHRLRAWRTLFWAVFGVLLGGVAPAAVSIMFMDFGSFAVGAALVGLLVGAAVGHLEPAARLRRQPSPRRWIAAVVLGPTLGFVWGGLAGVAGGVSLVAVAVLFGAGQIGAGGDEIFFLAFGGGLGAVVGAVPVSLFLWLRLALFDRRRLWWVAPVVALGLTPVASATLFMPVLGMIGVLGGVIY